MKKVFLIISVLASFLSAAQGVQGDSTAVDTTVAIIDSAAIRLAEYEQVMLENEIRRKEDSVKRQQLLDQISSLHARDQRKQQEIKRQIAEIETKDSLRNAQRNQKILALKQTTKGYAVSPFADTLFMVYLKIGPVLPEERAASTANKIRLLYDNSDFNPDSLTTVHEEATTDITYGRMIVMSVTDWDALWWNRSKSELASDYRQIIIDSILAEKQANSLKNLLIRAGLVTLIVVMALLLVWALNRSFRRINLWVIGKKDAFFKGIKVRAYELFPPERELQVVLRILQGIKWLVFLIIGYLALPLIFSIFPITQGWAETLFSWILTPAKEVLLSIWHYLPNLFYILVIFIFTRYFVRFVHFLSQEVQSGRLVLPGFHADWAAPTFNILRFLLYAFMFVVVYRYLPGSDSPIFQGVSVFLGILFSLGSSTAIANAVSGLVITYMRPYSIGDRVKIGQITGDVIEKSLLVTRIKTPKNEYITVPNAGILTGHTINYTTAANQGDGLILHTTVTIGYDVPWPKVHELLKKAAEKTTGIHTDKTPFVLQTSLDDFYVSYELNAFTHEPGRMAVIYSELHQNIQDAFNEADVEIMSPHYRANRDGEERTIPKN